LHFFARPDKIGVMRTLQAIILTFCCTLIAAANLTAQESQPAMIGQALIQWPQDSIIQARPKRQKLKVRCNFIAK